MPDLIITPPTITAGSPTPTVAFTLTRGGANVLPEVVGDRIPSAAVGDYTATWTATNGIGSPAVITRTATVVADVLPAGRLWVGAYDANSVTVTASAVNNVDQVRIAAVPASGGTAIVSDPITVDATYDFARTTLTGLAAGTEYDIEMRSVAGNPSGDQGWVKTRPATREAFKIGFASCFRVGNDYTIFDTIIDQNAGMLAFYNLGDRGYADIATNNVALYHAADDNVMAMTRVSRLHRTLPHIYMWDDHDYGPNDSAANSVSRPAAVAWFRNRVPVRPTLSGASDAPYYAHSPMPGVTVAMLDARSERNFGSGLMISAAQEAWLIALIQALPDGEALIINSSVPWIASSGSDMWFSASAQRQRIADAVTANCPGQVMIIGGDMHALAWDTGTNSVGGIPVAHAAPLGNAISTKGGPYTVGPITTTESQYGTLTFTPVTGGWTVRFEGWSVDPAGVQTRRIDATVSLSTPVTEAPAFTGTTAISGADTAGSVLTASPGTFTGQPTPTVAYQWRLMGSMSQGKPRRPTRARQPSAQCHPFASRCPTASALRQYGQSRRLLPPPRLQQSVIVRQFWTRRLSSC